MINRVLQLLGLALAITSSGFAGVYVASPADGSSTTGPTNVVGNAWSSTASPIVAMAVYVDDNLATSVYASAVNTTVNLTPGWHRVVVQSWDGWGNVERSQVNVLSVPPANGAGVVINAPADGANVATATTVSASATSNSAAPIVAMAVYLDSNLASVSQGASINAGINMGAGWHNVVVQSWDAWGGVQRRSINVQAVANSQPAYQSGSTYWNINQMTGWDDCGSCAGPYGYGVSVPHSIEYFHSNPSLDGASAQFWISGGVPYANALWWKELTPQPNATHFVYDLYFYLTDPTAAQALEFDLNQVVSGYRFIFGTQCDIYGSGQWDVWDTADYAWVPTGIGCPVPGAYSWHHLTLEFERAGYQAHFVSISLDGQTAYVNRYFWVIPNAGDELTPAIQLDTNSRAANLAMWVDKMNLTFW